MPRKETTGGWNGKGSIPYLDGLRAYSILNVLLAHCVEYLHRVGLVPQLDTPIAKPFMLVLANGILGVRVFFVLSGFLITSLLLEELHSTGRISITGFYVRRIARIFPAAYSYILTLVLLVSLRLMDLHWQPMVVAATYTWNYTTLNRTAAGGILGHFWSLALEEQFYLIWPTFLFFLGPRWAKRIALGCIVLLPFVRIASYFLVPTSRMEIYMMFHTSADQIMWGSLAAFAYKEGVLNRIRTLKYRNLIPWVCLLLVFILCPLIEDWFRGGIIITTPSIQGFSIVLMIFWLLSGTGGSARWVLGSWLIVQLGLISYSVYIWQQLFLEWPGLFWLGFPLNLLTALAAGLASYRLVEIPMRKWIRQLFSQPPPAH
jgi:peptidoglycan/LPS O-acetylase OafA/YrhL